MKRFMLLLLLMGSLLWAEGYNQCEVGLFFGNGMRNTKADAVKGNLKALFTGKAPREHLMEVSPKTLEDLKGVNRA